MRQHIGPVDPSNPRQFFSGSFKGFLFTFRLFYLKIFKKDWFLLFSGIYDLCVSPGVMYMSVRALRNQVWIPWSGVTGSCELMNMVLGLKWPSVPKEHHVVLTTELVSWGLLWICSPIRPPAQHPPASASGALGLQPNSATTSSFSIDFFFFEELQLVKEFLLG